MEGHTAAFGMRRYCGRAMGRIGRCEGLNWGLGKEIKIVWGGERRWRDIHDCGRGFGSAVYCSMRSGEQGGKENSIVEQSNQGRKENSISNMGIMPSILQLSSLI